jgi:hypothetical protein
VTTQPPMMIPAANIATVQCQDFILTSSRYDLTKLALHTMISNNNAA